MTPGVVSALHPDDAGAGRTQDIIDFHAAHHGSEGRITVGVGPHSAYDLGVERSLELSELAQELDAILHIHLSETSQENGDLESKYGQSVVKTLAENGVFNGRVLAAHCVWVDEDDISVLLEHEGAVAHCPLSNMKLGSGVAPVVSMREAGVLVSLGTDGPASNDTLDLWEEVKFGPLLAKVSAHDASLLGPKEVLTMATRLGAEAVGLSNVGSLKPGYKADLLRIETNHPAFCLLYTSPSPRDRTRSRMPSSA